MTMLLNVGRFYHHNFMHALTGLGLGMGGL